MPKSSFILADSARRNFLTQSVPNLNIQNVGVADCLKFRDLTQSDVQQIDVGRSVVLGVRNIPRQGDESRVFGIPSIRNDVSPPRYVSIANINNYGDETNASQLLNPCQYSNMGLNEQDFTKLRSKEEIKDLVQSIGYKYKIGKFQGIFMRAQQIVIYHSQNCLIQLILNQGNFEGKVSLSCFIKAMSELNSIL